MGWAGAGLAFTTGGAGGAIVVPFVVAALSAVAAAEAVARMALLPMLFKAPEAVVAVWSIRRPTIVLISPPDRACAAAAPSALARSTFMRCSSGVGGLGVTGGGALAVFMIVLMVV